MLVIVAPPPRAGDVPVPLQQPGARGGPALLVLIPRPAPPLVAERFRRLRLRRADDAGGPEDSASHREAGATDHDVTSLGRHRDAEPLAEAPIGRGEQVSSDSIRGLTRAPLSFRPPCGARPASARNGTMCSQRAR